MKQAGLSLEQAPDLWIPVRFFVSAPVSILVAGVLLIWQPQALLSSYHPSAIALTHLGTVGFLMMVMMGALYQMLPVVAGSPVPSVGSAAGVHALLVLGIGCVVGGLVFSQPMILWVAGAALSLALTGFLIPVVMAILKAPTRDATVLGMLLSTASLVVLATLGVAMGVGHAGGAFPGVRGEFIGGHLSVAFLGWVGALILSLSFKVIPMFYLTKEEDPRAAKAMLLSVAAGVVGALLALVIPQWWAPLLAAPAAVSVWAVHPVRTLKLLKNRRRKRKDTSMLFWKAGLAGGVVTGILALLSLFMGPVVGMLFVWSAIWAWAGLIVHGMLYRIVPFLVWFHRLSPLVGLVPVPPVRRILPELMVQRSLTLHLLSIAVGVVAIISGWSWMGAALGLSLLLVAGQLGRCLWTVLQVQAPPVPEVSAK